MKSVFSCNLSEHLTVFSSLTALEELVNASGAVIADVLAAGGKLMLCGNGGSAADSQHIAAELTGRFLRDRAPLAGLALSTDTSALTCIGNDYGFDEVFERQVRGLGRKGDCLVALSTSGNSRNVVRAVESANAMGIITIGLLGRDGGELRNLCTHAVVVRSSITARIQEAHIFIGHTWCGIIEQRLFDRQPTAAS